MTYRHLLTTVTLSLVAVFLATIGVSLTQATDGKIYPGSMCVRVLGTPSLNYSAIGNSSATTWLQLDCPVIHDSITRNISSGWVQVIDQHYSSDVTCGLNSFYRSGSSFFGWWTPLQNSSGSSSGPQTLSFGSVGSNAIAHYFVGCRIPPTYNGNASYIISYKVDENE